MSPSNDYHDYVFRDGKLVGEFEDMYRNSEVLPWHQDEQAQWIDVRLTKEVIRNLSRKLGRIYDLGCGTGHYLNLIAGEFLAPGGSTYGFDISETACKLAEKTFPNGKYSVLDITEPMTENRLGSTIQTHGPKYPNSLFMLRGTLWYLYPKLTSVVDNIDKMMQQGDKLLVVQNFPPLDRPFIGKEILPNYEALINFFERRFSLEQHIWYENKQETSNDNWFIGLFSPNSL